MLVLRVSTHAPSRQQELAEVRERIRQLLAEAMVREKVQAQGKELLAQLANGKTVEQLAGEGKYEWKVALRYGRGAAGVPPELGQAAFDTPRGDNGSGRGTVVSSGGDVFVFAFDNFREGRLDELSAEQRAMLVRLLQKSRGRETVAYYEQSLRDRADIEML